MIAFLGTGLLGAAFVEGLLTRGGTTVTDPANGGFFIFGGTSAGSPQWAALTAIGDQMGHHRLGTINPSLYQLASSHFFSNALYHDITVGQNGVMEFNADNSTVNIPGFTAKRGWDAASGLGSPKADRLIPALVFLSH